MGESWDHSIRRLEERELLLEPRINPTGCGVRKGQIGKCGRPNAYACSFRCRSGRDRGIHWKTVHRCAEHGRAWAGRHDLEVPDPLRLEAGRIVEVVFGGGRPSGRGYTLELASFRSALLEDGSQHPELLRDGEPLEVYVFRSSAWRPCEFHWDGVDAPWIAVELPSPSKIEGVPGGRTRLPLDARDVFRPRARS